MEKKSLNISERARNWRNGVQLVYVLECIDNSSRAADEGINFESDYERIRFFFEGFNEEFNDRYNKRLYPNLSERIGQYLQGLPSVCSVDYWNDEIIKLGISWGVLDKAEGRKADKFVNDWYRVLVVRLLQIAQKVGYPVFNLY